MGLIEEKRKMIMSEMEAGRGSAEISASPLSLEPVFRPFNIVPHRGTFFDRLFKDKEKINPARIIETEKSDNRLRYIRLRPGGEDKNTLDIAEQFILSLPGAEASFEIIGHDGKVSFQLAAEESIAQTTISQIGSHFGSADAFISDDLVRAVMSFHPVTRAYRLKSSHFFPLQLSGNAFDPFAPLLGILGNLGKGETGVFQVVFQSVTHAWQENMRKASRSPWNPSESPFVDFPDLPKIVDKKLSKPLFAVSLRMLASSGHIISAMEVFYNQLDMGDNGIVPVSRNYPVASILQRNTFVHGTILNLTELSFFLHLPAPELLHTIPGIEQVKRSYPVPSEFTKDGPMLGMNTHRGVERIVCHADSLPNRHVYSSGKSGYGKSNLILFSVMERIKVGDGIAVIDPHGSLVKEGVLPRILKQRIDDVVYFNAGDFAYPIAINPLSHKGTKLEKEHIRTDLLNFFEDLFEASLGVNVQHALNFLIVTLLSCKDSNLHDMERLLIDKTWRLKLLKNIDDERILSFWESEFPLLEKRGIVTAITNKLSPLILPDSAIAPMLKQRENRIDFRDIMDKRKIFLCNLSHGDIGKRNSQLLGKLLVSKLQIAAMMREGDGKSPDFYLYIDEFQHMTCPSMADILSGARKYGLHLWLANQMIGDIPDSIQRHIFNASTLIFFASDSPSDQALIEKNLSRRFKAEDIGSLKKGETFVKMVASAFNMKTVRILDPPEVNCTDEIIASSRKKYSASGIHSFRRNEKVEGKELFLARTCENQKAETIEENTRPELLYAERTFLETVYHNPSLSVTGIYRLQKLSGYMGDKLKNALKSKGLAHEVTTHLGQKNRIAKFLLLTPQGFEVIDIDFGNEGKGGVMHRYWQSVIRLHAESQGYQVIIEAPIPESKETVDLGLSRNGKQIAVEISVTTRAEHELKNVKKCLAHYDRIVTLFFDEAKAEEFAELLRKTLTDEEQKRVTAGLAYDFCRFF